MTLPAGGDGAGERTSGGSRVRPRIVCLSTDASAESALQGIVAAVVPDAVVSVADAAILRGAPEGDYAIVAAGAPYRAVRELLHDVRGRGFAGGIIIVVEAPAELEAQEGTALARFGVDAVVGTDELARALPQALEQVISQAERRSRSPQGATLVASLRRTRELIAAGEMASTLQHRLNNPLAALLAEAQLLELEPLAPEHASSVTRIVELCRRVIEVTRSIEDITGGGSP